MLLRLVGGEKKQAVSLLNHDALNCGTLCQLHSSLKHLKIKIKKLLIFSYSNIFLDIQFDFFLLFN